MLQHDAVIGRDFRGARRASLSHLVRFLLALLALAAPCGEAATKVWNNVGGGNWSNAANWIGGLPGFGDDVDITLAGTYTVILDVDSENLRSLVLGGSSGTQTLLINAKRLQMGSAPDAISTVNANGVISLSDGTVDTLGNAARALLLNFGTIVQAVGTSTMQFDEFSNFVTGLGGRVDVQQGSLAVVGLQSFTFSNAGTLTLGDSALFSFSGIGVYLVNSGTVLLNGNVLILGLATVSYSQTGGITDLRRSWRTDPCDGIPFHQNRCQRRRIERQRHDRQ